LVVPPILLMPPSSHTPNHPGPPLFDYDIEVNLCVDPYADIKDVRGKMSPLLLACSSRELFMTKVDYL